MIVVAGLLICILLVVFRSQFRSFVHSKASSTRLKVSGQYGVDNRVRQYGEVVRARLEPDFRRAGVSYPPTALVLIGLKEEKLLEVYAAGKDGVFHFIKAYSIVAASGHAGPKLREGNLQVPEGLYRIESLNPNSLYHLALRVNYPNDFDRANAAAEHRENLGGDIMIHGSDGSVGCLAMGDPTSEDLFVLAALTGIQNIQVILCPVDFRVREVSTKPDDPSWLPGTVRANKGGITELPDKSPQ